MLASILDAFVQQSPVSVMMRGIMEQVFRAERLDTLFKTHAKVQYTQELLFSEVVNLLSLVVCGIHPSVNAAYKAKASELSVERAAFYQKLNGIEIRVSAALLRETAGELSQLIHQMGGATRSVTPWLCGANSRWQCVSGNRASVEGFALHRGIAVTRKIAGRSRPRMRFSGGHLSL